MNPKDSEDLTRTGPGTVMGDFMRQYWMPAAKSSELEVDGPPMRLMLLGEKLIAFRDSKGRVGIMSHLCPHRGASLFLGRNEQNGLRCLYHGWKFDVAGNTVEMPNVPSQHDFKERVKARAYKVYEKHGVIWVYMGDRDPAPPLPLLEAAQIPESELLILFVQRDCNWAQALEGDIDTSHASFLHYGGISPDSVPEGHFLEPLLSNPAPEYKVEDAPWGITYGAYRRVKIKNKDQMYWRVSNFMFPFWTETPAGEFGGNVHARAWVPMDDHHAMSVIIRWREIPKSLSAPMKEGKALPERMPDFMPNGTGWLDRWRLKANESNDWMIDRDAQRQNKTFSGISNILLQDQAIQESMGPIVDHSVEHLGYADMMVARTRRKLLDAARAFRETKQSPPGVDTPEVYFEARGGHFTVDPEKDWRAACREELAKGVHPSQQKDTA
jgi:phenylpropionate dioxygenase-like ring-hydroxylating dioxygenase large terminal subunit